MIRAPIRVAGLRRPFRASLLLLCAGTATMHAAAVADETRASADVTAGVGYANNPFAGTGGSGLRVSGLAGIPARERFPG